MACRCMTNVQLTPDASASTEWANLNSDVLVHNKIACLRTVSELQLSISPKPTLPSVPSLAHQ